MPELREYQKKGVEFVLQRKRAIIGDEMRVGKTAQALEVIKQVNPERALFIVPQSALHTWQLECKKWGVQEPTLIHGELYSRHHMWKNNDWCITTYSTFLRDVRITPKMWGVIILDESHKIRNRRTKSYKAIAGLRSEYLICLTGTPASRGAQDLWTMLHLLRPHVFRSYWTFVNSFCIVDQTPFGQEIIGTKNVESLRELLSNYMIRRTFKQVRPEIPKITRQRAPIEMTDEQRKHYEPLRDDMLAFLDSGEIILASTVLTKILRLRQLLVCPKLLSEDLGYGAGLNMIADHLEGRDDAHIVIYTPFAAAIPYIQTFLTERGFGPSVAFRGGMKLGLQKEREEAFADHRCAAVVSIRYGLGFSLETADTGYMLGCEWDFDVNEQAEMRIQSTEDTDRPTHVYYIYHENTVEDGVLEIVNGKHQNVSKVLKTAKQWKELLK